MANSMKMGIIQTQRLALNQSLIQSIELLQLTSLELAERISKELLENPVLEEDNAAEPSLMKERDGDIKSRVEEELSGGESLLQRQEEQRLNFENYSDSGYSNYSNDDNKKQSFIENVITQEVTLQQHLLSQARLTTKDRIELALLENIITSIDDNGFLSIDIEAIIRDNKRTNEDVLNALSVIHNFDPVGCGTRNVQESLIIQAELLYPDDEMLHRILRDYFRELEMLDYEKISKALDITINDVIIKSKLIQLLNPFPGAQYSTNRIKYIVPDVEVKYVDDEIHVNMNDDWIPLIRINSYYSNLLRKKSIDKSAKEYLKDKMQSARGLIQNISNRRDTIMRVVTAIMERQREFLSKGIGHLNPLTISIIADDVRLHKSTISRVISGKYIQTSWGVFELKRFFVSRIGSYNEEDQSSDKVMNLIGHIINNEDESNPVTDEEILIKLKEHGIKIARRTIAKYRGIMNIPPSSRRKRFNMIKRERSE
ncbi:MAG: RNA polymerase factor sigma-54 [Spirochaetota bacterium]|nr:RNA polymerase factor sigma-54 [Spirochaetota bacterium]